MPFALYSDSDLYSLSDVLSVLSANGLEIQGRELNLSDSGSDISSLSASPPPLEAFPFDDAVSVSRHARAYEPGDLLAHASMKTIHVLPTDGQVVGPTALICANCTEAIVGPGYSLPITLIVGDTGAAAHMPSVPDDVAVAPAVATPVMTPAVAPPAAIPAVAAPVTTPAVAPPAVIPAVAAPFTTPAVAPLAVIPAVAPPAKTIRPRRPALYDVTQAVSSFGFGQPLQATAFTPAGPIPPAAAAVMTAVTVNALNAISWDVAPPDASTCAWYAVSKGTCIGLSNNWGLVSPHVTGVSCAVFAKRATWFEARRLLLDLRNSGRCEQFA
ncbi:hypothetical protein BDZ89DRAFT_1150652 [Hymenopellis radicata]|nr:hypothetical protein BDZ89DRAFT_1150652 [Hymenopellis radicata]